MGLDSIAYGPDEVCLLTIDGADLLAYDAQTEAPRWQLALGRPLVGVCFVDPQVLPGGGANPWRAQSLARAAVAVDADGHLHLVDTTLGQALGEIGPFGKPLAIASTVSGAAIALAVEDKVLVWRGGEQHQVAVARPRCVAFSNDGATLAVGTEKGELRTFHLGTGRAPEQTYRAELRGAVSVLAQHPDGSWVVVAAHGVVLVNASGTSRLDRLSAGTRRLCFDGNGARLATQHSGRGIVVYEWPRLSVLMRVEYTDRSVGGLAFGPDDWLGVALDHGDANKIDVVTSAVNRTDTHPGREHRSWTLLVEGKKERLSAQEAEDVRRMKDPFHAPAPSASGFAGNGFGGRIGVGALISIALISLRVCVRLSTPSSSSWTFNNPTVYVPPSLKDGRCDRVCASDRLRTLKVACEDPSAGCVSEANAALRAFESGNCAEAKATVARLATSAAVVGGSLLGVEAMLAKLGLEEACAAEVRPRVVRHAELVRLKGPGLEPSYERIPEAEPGQGENPSSVWAAPDGTIFVATTVLSDVAVDKAFLYRRTKSGAWSSVYERQRSSRARVFGRSASDVYVLTDDALVHFDGASWQAVPGPTQLETFVAAGVAGSDVIIAGADEASMQVQRRRGSAWVKESIPSDVSFTSLFSGSSSTLWALAEEADDDVLLQRSANGTWTKKTPPTTSTLTAVWASPTGEIFVGASDAVYRSKNGGATWTSDALSSPALELWGRASNDVYARTPSGLAHYDGKAWSPTSYTGNIETFTGTASEIFVLRRTEDDGVVP